MPTFTFNDLQKQPYKYADIKKILRTVNSVVLVLHFFQGIACYQSATLFEMCFLKKHRQMKMYF